MEIQQYNNHYLVYIPPSATDFKRKLDAVKRIPGRQWWDSQRVWAIPVRNYPSVDLLFSAITGQVSRPQQKQEDIIIDPLPELNVTIPLKREMYHFQKQGTAYCIEKGSVLIGDQQGLGKAQPLYSNIATPSGWVQMGNMRIGDEVFGDDGKVYNVTGIYPQGKRKACRIIFNDGVYTDCDQDHIWKVTTILRKQRKSGWTFKTTQELVDSGLTHHASPYRLTQGNPVLKYEIPICEPVQYVEKSFIIHPYILGALIGDGYLAGTGISLSLPNDKIGIVDEIRKFLPVNLKIYEELKRDVPRYSISPQPGNKNIYLSEIRSLGLNVLSEAKFIPAWYQIGSVDQRISLLKGLMDTDGSASKNRITFHTVSSTLADDVAELVRSLGGIAIKRSYDRSKENKGTEYQVNVKIKFNPFTVKYKADQWWPTKRAFASRYIKEIIYLEDVEQQCISISSVNKLYLTDNFIVTHNTIEAIAAVEAMNLFPCLVITKKTLILNWEKEWSDWTNRQVLVFSTSKKNTWPFFFNTQLAEVGICNYESLANYFVSKIEVPKGEQFRVKHVHFKEQISIFKSIIIDESHYVKDAKTKRTKLCKGLTMYLKEKGVFLLSGTPALNDPMELYTQLAILNRDHLFGGYSLFKANYSGKHNKHNLKQLNHLLHKHCYFRRLKTEAKADLPIKTRQVILCDINNREEYNLAEQNFVRYLREKLALTEGQINTKLRGEVMVQMGILKKIAAHGKLESVREWVDNLLEDGEKIVLFAYHKDIQMNLLTSFKGAVAISNQQVTPMAVIQENKRRFMTTRDCNVIVCSISAAAEGHTLNAASYLGMVELPWHFGKAEQCEDRIHRITNVEPATCAYFIAENTIDRHIYKLIMEKKEMHDSITGTEDEVEETVIDQLINIFNQK